MPGLSVFPWGTRAAQRSRQLGRKEADKNPKSQSTWVLLKYHTLGKIPLCRKIFSNYSVGESTLCSSEHASQKGDLYRRPAVHFQAISHHCARKRRMWTKVILSKAAHCPQSTLPSLGDTARGLRAVSCVPEFVHFGDYRSSPNERERWTGVRCMSSLPGNTASPLRSYTETELATVSLNVVESLKPSSGTGHNEEDPTVKEKNLYRAEFEKRIKTWQSLDPCFSNFPHYLSDKMKAQLLDCVTANIKYPNLAKYGGGLSTASQTILLSGQSGTEEYQDSTVQALCREVNANYLPLDAELLAPKEDEDGDEHEDKDVHEQLELKEREEDEDDDEDEDEDDDEDREETGFYYSESEDDSRERSKRNDKERLHRLVGAPGLGAGSGTRIGLQHTTRNDMVYIFDDHESPKEQMLAPMYSLHKSIADQPPWFGLKVGDRVKFVGDQNGLAKDWREKQLPDGRRMWIHKDCYVNAWPSYNRQPFHQIFDKKEPSQNPGQDIPMVDLAAGQKGTIMELLSDQPGKCRVQWDPHAQDEQKEAEKHICNVSDIQLDVLPAVHKREICRQALFELLEEYSKHTPLIVFIANAPRWLENMTYDKRSQFLERVEESLKSLAGSPVMLVGGMVTRPAMETEEGQFLWSPGARRALWRQLQVRIGRMKDAMMTRSLLEDLEVHGAGLPTGMSRIFANTVAIEPPLEGAEKDRWNEMREAATENRICRENKEAIQKVMKQNMLSCDVLPDVASKMPIPLVERVVGLARSICVGRAAQPPPVVDDHLVLSPESFQEALEMIGSMDSATLSSPKPLTDSIEMDEYETMLISEVIPPAEVGVSFNDIGALEDVKAALRELVMLPLQRPELFARGTLSKPIKGVLLFGPPGTGKTLLAKAVATEAGANFINISSSVVTSKWFGDAEKLTRAVFTLARKLAPAVIFVDEVDSLLGARGGGLEHEATRKMRNEFMAAWDGLRSSDTERVLVLAATNRPFDLDDAVIRRMPRRIMVGLPDAENRAKILRKVLANEVLEENFCYEDVASLTVGYSGSDLRNLCIAAAYRPIRELVNKEMGLGSGVRLTTPGETPPLRPINLEDFRQAKVQVGASVSQDAQSITDLQRWNEMYGEGGNRKKRSFGFTGT